MGLTVTCRDDDRVEIVVYKPDPKFNGVIQNGVGIALTAEQAEALCRAIRNGSRCPVDVA